MHIPKTLREWLEAFAILFILGTAILLAGLVELTPNPFTP